MKFMTLVFALILSGSVLACGGDKTSSTTDSDTSTTQTTETTSEG